MQELVCQQKKSIMLSFIISEEDHNTSPVKYIINVHNPSLLLPYARTSTVIVIHCEQPTVRSVALFTLKYVRTAQ